MLSDKTLMVIAFASFAIGGTLSIWIDQPIVDRFAYYWMGLAGGIYVAVMPKYHALRDDRN